MSNLKDIRSAQGLSQSQLGKLAEVSIPMIQKYEQGIKDINKAEALTIYKLATALGTTMESLLELTICDIKVNPNFKPNETQLKQYSYTISFKDL